MARANTSTIDGLIVGYGTRDTYNPDMAIVHTKGRVKEVVAEIDYRNYLGFATSTAASTKDFYIPSGSQIISSQFVVKEGFTLLTSVNIGTKIKAGTTIVAAGLHSAVALAAFDAVGETEEGAGTQVGGVALTANAYISFDVTGTAPTAGHIVLTVRYYEPVAAQTPPAVLVGVQ